MANEIRVLEDQLYEADYENEVQRQKLHRANDCCDQMSVPPSNVVPAPAIQTQTLPSQPEAYTESIPREGIPLEPIPMDHGFDDSHIGPSQIDQGSSIQIVPTPSQNPGALTDPPMDPRTNPRTVDPKDAEFIPTPESGFEGNLPAPTEPQPPGPSDIRVPPIVPGEVLPPPVRGEGIPVPPGKIDLPNAKMTETPIVYPDRLQLHPGLSGGHRFDDAKDVTGMFLVVNVVDQKGRMIDIRNFDVDAKMTVVAIDPNLPIDESRIGRWEFSERDVLRFMRPSPVSGFHVPIRWQGSKPTGENVVVHVRLQTEDEEMRCEAKLSVGKVESIAEWTPRGKSSR